jgi:hypothetical protein
MVATGAIEFNETVVRSFIMRSSQPLYVVPLTRTIGWRPAATPKMRRPSPLPTVIPTKSSYLQRLLWLFMGH